MKYIYTLLISTFFTIASFAQETEFRFSIGPNVTFPSFNDDIYSYPPMSPNTGFYSYSPLPSNIYRKTIPKLGLQGEGDISIKLQNKLSVRSGLKFQLFRYGFNPEYKENPFDPFGRRWDKEPGYQPPNYIATLSDLSKHTRILNLSIPLQVNYQINSRFYTHGGINIATPIFVAQKYKSISIDYQNSYFTDTNFPGYIISSSNISTSEINVTDKSISAFNRVNYGLQLGVGYNISKIQSIRMDYIRYFRNTYSGEGKNQDLESLINSLSINYSWLLEL